MESMGLTSSFWEGKTVLLTGHTGFKGSWLTLWLRKLGAKVVGFSLNPDENNHLYNALRPKTDVKDYFGDVRDLGQLTQAFLDSNPDIAIHMAAQPLVQNSYKNPVYSFETNVVGTVNFQEACRKSENVKAIINITTDKVYEVANTQEVFKESDRLGSNDPYSSSKACSEIVTHSYRKSFYEGKSISCGIATARAGNVIGGGDFSENRIVPDIFRAARGGKELKIRMPEAVRPWQLVLEPLDGYLKLAEALYKYPDKYSGAWNFGPEPSGHLTVKNLVSAFRDKIAFPVSFESNKLWDHETRELRLDNSKAKSQLSWKPKLSIEDMVDYTEKWYSTFSSIENIADFSANQIDDYSRK